MDRIKKFFKSTAGMVLIVTILVGIIVHATTFLRRIISVH